MDAATMDQPSPPVLRNPEKAADLCGPRHWSRTPFPVNESINKKVELFDGPLDQLRADAIVNPTNENFTQLNQIGKLAGRELVQHLRTKTKFCATGDVRVTPGFASNFKHIIHAVPPKYQPKYKTAAETALFHTYFRIMESMLELNIRTCVIPTLTTTKSNLPIKQNCHLHLRVVRRMLERKPERIDKIYIMAAGGPPPATDIYRNLFVCYFPRSALDESSACYNLDSSVGGPNGEPVIPEREIRIVGKPTGLAVAADELNNNEPIEESIDLRSGLDLSTVIGKTPFSKMREDLEPGRPQQGQARYDQPPARHLAARKQQPQSSANNIIGCGVGDAGQGSKALACTQYRRPRTTLRRREVLRGCVIL